MILFPLQVVITLVVIVALLLLFKDVIIERLAAAALSSSLGAADSYSLRVTNTSVFSMLGGKVKEAWLTAKGVRPKKGPVIDYLKVRALDVEFDTKAVRRVRDATFTATVMEEDVRDYLKSVAPPGVYPDVTMKRDGIVIKVRKDILGLSIPLELAGKLQMKAKHLLIFSPSGADIADGKIPSDVLEKVFRSLNPLLDTAALKHPLEVDRLDPEDGALTLKGHIRFKVPVMLRR